MGCTNQYSLFSHKSQPLLIFLLLSTFTTHCSCIAQGRSISKFNEPAKREMRNEDVINLEEMVMMRRLIGSRPPRCERICQGCSHCEAVQVPVVLAQKLETQRFLKIEEDAPKTIYAYSRAHYVSNYKPMCWKCKCGDLIFNP